MQSLACGRVRLSTVQTDRQTVTPEFSDGVAVTAGRTSQVQLILTLPLRTSGNEDPEVRTSPWGLYLGGLLTRNRRVGHLFREPGASQRTREVAAADSV